MGIRRRRLRTCCGCAGLGCPCCWMCGDAGGGGGGAGGSRRRAAVQLLAGALVGILVGTALLSTTRLDDPLSPQLNCKAIDPAVPFAPAPASVLAPTTTWSAGDPSGGDWSSLGASDDPLGLLTPPPMGAEGPRRHHRDPRRSLLLVGVMTAERFLGTRAVAVWDTWGQSLPGAIAFFAGATARPPPGRSDLPLVALRGVDDAAYPPQKKSFKMLEWMWRHYGDHFEWFMRADDDVYVRTDKLEKLLRSVDSSKAYFIGQAGRGNPDEYGLLSLEYDENFCMGGPGVLLSRATLARVAPRVRECLRDLYTSHEDVELGRCVRRFAGIPCTWSFDMRTILYHNSSGNAAFTGNLKQHDVHQAITLHPVKQHRHQYRVHNYMRHLRIREARMEALHLHREIAQMRQLLGDTNPARTPSTSREVIYETVPSFHRFKPRTETEVINWDMITSRSIFSDSSSNPRKRLETALREAINDVVQDVMDDVNAVSRKRGRQIEFREILYGYRRVVPQFGAEYILDMLLVYKKFRGRKITVPVRRHAYLQHHFTALEIRETVDGVEVLTPSEKSAETEAALLASASFSMEAEAVAEVEAAAAAQALAAPNEDLRQAPTRSPPPTPPPPPPPWPKPDASDDVLRKTVHLILPLSGRSATFVRFVRVLEENCLMTGDKVALVLVLFPSDREDTADQSEEVVRDLQRRYPRHRFSVVRLDERFARARALQLGAAQVPDSDDDLLMFIDVDMLFTSATLNRVRLNTIRGRQTYFPIVYSEFDPAVLRSVLPVNLSNVSSAFETGKWRLTSAPDRIVADAGYWRMYGFGIAAMYKSDLKRAGGFDTTIRGWGREDVDLFERIMAIKDLRIFRAVDPDLVHVFHVVDCDVDLEPTQLQMCLGTRADMLGSVRTLATMLLRNGPRVLDLARRRRAHEKQGASKAAAR